MAGNPNDLRQLLPRHKHDSERAERLIRLGYPAIAPVLPELFEWIQDMNWPVAAKVAPFLSQLGRAIEPDVRRILSSNDGMWKYWLLTAVIAPMPPQERQNFRPVLETFLADLTADDRANEADSAAQEILALPS